MSNIKNGDAPAMPIEFSGFGQWAPEAHTGLTKREYFALKIHCANLAANPHYENMGYTLTSGISDSIAEADALLAELEK